jgi:multiple sugar transport system permease protein
MKKAIERKQHLVAYGFVLPFFVVFAAMLVAPLAYSGYLSFFVDRLVGDVSFVGFGNYVRAFQDPNFLAGLGRTALILLVQVPIMLGLALFFALALDSGRARGSKALRLLIFLPYAVPGVVSVLMWGYLYGRQFGLVAQIIRGIGLPSPDLLSGPTILFSIMNIITWAYVGYNMIVMYSALKSIPAELYEAAEIDGASQWRLAWSVKIPLIRPAILLTVIFSVIGSFQIFNEPSLLLELAPTAITQSFTPNFYAYNLAFVNQDINYAAAIAFLLGFVIMIVSYVVQLSTQRRERQS